MQLSHFKFQIFARSFLKKMTSVAEETSWQVATNKMMVIAAEPKKNVWDCPLVPVLVL